MLNKDTLIKIFMSNFKCDQNETCQIPSLLADLFIKTYVLFKKNTLAIITNFNTSNR